MTTNFELAAPLPSQNEGEALPVRADPVRAGSLFFLARFAAMGHAFLVISNLRIPFIALFLGAQLLSYLGSGYLLRSVVTLAAKPVSTIDGAAFS
jgi:hypothetical protein